MECRLKAKKCGGCPMLGLDYAEQLKQKEAAVRKLVGKYGPVAPIRGAENPCHYRNKVISTFAAGPGGKLVSGIYAAGTHKVLPVESCLLQDEVLDTVMQAVRAAASTCRYQPYNEDKGTGLLRHCLLRRGVVSGQVMVVLVTAQPVLPGAKNFVRALLAEAEKRDHRRLGKELNLFHLQDEAPGMIFWHAKGWAIWQVVEQLMRRVYQENGYLEVRTPQVIDRSLWERSGHWAKYRSNMFTTESENRYYALKPMNCPGHIQIFNSALRSYRDLPLRIGEFGLCHRNEPSGSLHGMMRVRGFTQDDGHIFCTEDQILTECVAYTKLVREVYHLFGFDDIAFKVATRPEMRIGEDAVWDKAEEALLESLR